MVHNLSTPPFSTMVATSTSFVFLKMENGKSTCIETYCGILGKLG